MDGVQSFPASEISSQKEPSVSTADSKSTDVKPDPKTNDPNAKPDPKTNVKLDPKTTDAKPDPKTTDAKTDPKTDAKLDPKTTDANTDAKPDPKTTDAKLDPKRDAKLNPKTTDAEAEDAKPDSRTTDAEPDSKPQSREHVVSPDNSDHGLASKMTSNPALKPVLNAFEAYLTDKRTVQMKRQLSVGVFQAVSELCSGLAEGNKKQICEICDGLLADQMKGLHLVYQFLGQVFRALTGGIDAHLANTLLMMHSLLSLWTHDNSALPVCIVSEGFLMEHIDEICMLRSSSVNPEVIRHLVGLNLSTIHNCSQVADVKRYFLSPEFDCVAIFKPFTTSPFFEVSLHAKFILASLSSLLSEAELDQLLYLTSEEQASFIKAFCIGTTSENREVECNSCSFLVTEALCVLKNLVLNLRNCEVIVNNDGMVLSLSTLLAAGSLSEQKAGCDLMWTILSMQNPLGSKFKEKLLSKEIAVEDYIAPLLKSDDQELQMLADSVLFFLDKKGGSPRSLSHAEICYSYAHYTECVCLCESLIKTLSSKDDLNCLKHLMGKAHFFEYQKLKFQLERQNLAELQHTQEYQGLHKKCYQTAKSVIGLLGNALDNGLLTSDDLKMLDLAMLDYVVNAKSTCSRCLLCHRKQKLRRSHFFPKSLLETISKGAAKPEDQKIFRHSEDYYTPLKSAKELFYEMFCSSCENLLSKHGETQFLPQFFLKIYDQSNPKQLTASQSLEYGTWLHQFCTGLLFRGLAVQPHDIYINSDKIYNLFRKCRGVLCHIDPTYFPHTEAILPEKLDVFVLVNPSESPDELATYPFMNKVLTSEMVDYMGIQGPLDDDIISRPHQLHAFVVHFGMINVLVSIGPSECDKIPKECIVHPEGGSYPVPEDRERRCKVPKGLWKAYQIKAERYATNVINIPDRVAREFENKKIQQPSEAHQALFPIIASSAKASEAALLHVMPSSFPEVTRIANFLPDQFIVRPPHAPMSVSLPAGHKILVHQSHTLGEGYGGTIFLAVGNRGAYKLDKPYVLYHHYEQGLQLNYGSFICPVTLEAREPLLDAKPKTLLKGTEFDVVENFRSVCPVQLLDILGEKGIANCMSLLKRIGYNFDKAPSFDVKCNPSLKCWYCSELCQVCMNPSTFGLTTRSSDGSTLRFCGESCQMFNSKNSKDVSSFVNVWTPSEATPPLQFQARCIETTHKELLFMHMQGLLTSGQYCKINLAICAGDGTTQYPKDKAYVVYYLRTLHEQQILEFFLGDDLEPEEALPYGVTKTTEEAIVRKRATGEMKKLVFMALLAKGYLSLHTLLEGN